MDKEIININPRLLAFDISMIIGFVFGVILALNISMYPLVLYYIGVFGFFSISWVILYMHSERIQKYHDIVSFAFMGVGVGITISGFIIIICSQGIEFGEERRKPCNDR